VNEIPRADATLRQELAKEAKELLDNRVFQAAILTCRKQWFGELMTTADDTAQRELVAKLKALEAIPQRLESLITDELIAQKKRKS